jgi:hypothetical protein
MGLHFIYGGAQRGEPGVIAILQENPTQLNRASNHDPAIRQFSIGPDGISLADTTLR